MKQRGLFDDDDKRRARSNTDKVLSLLYTGPKRTDELVTITHRFATAIHGLRKRGHEVRVEKLGKGISLYSLAGFRKLVEVTDEMKQAYYLSQHWKTVREWRLLKDNMTCCWCKIRTVPLQVHHWQYDLFNESIDDLMTLCEQCHTKLHELDSVLVHFPHSVTPEIAERLQALVDGSST